MPLYVFVIAVAVFIALRMLLRGRQFDATLFLFARVPINAIGFRLRRLFRWRRGLPELKNEPKSDLFAHVGLKKTRTQLTRREEELRAQYNLVHLYECSTREVYRENLYVLDMLDRHAELPDAQAKALSAIDVGSKDFRYGFALERWLARSKMKDAKTRRDVVLVGIEIDGHPIYKDLHSRADYGEAYAKAVVSRTTGNNVTYVVADFLARTDHDLDVVFCFFPFVLRYALVRWGLPLGHFEPERFFKRAWDALRPGGLLVIVNHTAEEHERQLELLKAVDFELLGHHSAASALVDYVDMTKERTLTLAKRPFSSSVTSI